MAPLPEASPAGAQEAARAPALSAALSAGLNTLGLSLSVTQQQQVLGHLALLQRWNRVHNLTAIRDPAEMLTLHALDCLAALPPVTAWLSAPGRLDAGDSIHVLDVGSGGGLPGVVWAIARPDWQIHCVDSVGKKVSFVRQVAAELALPNLHAVHNRVEHHRRPLGYTLITSRAFASLADFTRLSRHLLGDGACWVALKGQDPAQERHSVGEDVDLFHVEQLHPPGVDAQRCLVWMRPAAPPAR